jgi:Tfp pilus assembly PilM family ATPase
MSAARGWFGRTFLDPEAPNVGIELRTRSVGVVRTTNQGGQPTFVAAAVLDLPPGVIKLSMTENNVIDPAALGRVLKAALERVGVMSGGRAALVLPDPVARVSLVQAPELRGKPAKDVQELLRFKLQKSVPFDIRQAHVCSVPAGEASADDVLTAAMLPPVIGGYEALCHAAGLVPGLVEVCSLALLRASMPPSPMAAAGAHARCGSCGRCTGSGARGP